MTEQLYILAGSILIGASVAVIILVIPRLRQQREDWLRAQRKKRALAEATRAAEDLSIAMTALGTAFTRAGTAFVQALAAAMTPAPEIPTTLLGQRGQDHRSRTGHDTGHRMTSGHGGTSDSTSIPRPAIPTPTGRTPE